jgi:dTDP-D-glucose 4,6-dehydratase
MTALHILLLSVQNNIMGTHVLLESAKVAKIARFIHVSTDEVYGEQTNDQEAMSEEQVSYKKIIILLA